MKNEKTIFLYEDGIGSVSLVDYMGSDITVVNSARVSFGDTKSVMDARDRKLVRYLIKHRHTSTLEHNLITFKFVVPLFVRSQHHRHRTWSYNEISRRYTDKDIQFYIPKSFRTQHKSNRQASNEKEMINPVITPIIADTYINSSDAIQKSVDCSLDLFNKLLDGGVCREQARMVLPQNLYTEYYGTVNLNNLLKFIDLRIHEGAQWEIQKVAEACLDIATELFPITVNAYKECRDEIEST